MEKWQGNFTFKMSRMKIFKSSVIHPPSELVNKAPSLAPTYWVMVPNRQIWLSFGGHHGESKEIHKSWYQ